MEPNIQKKETLSPADTLLIKKSKHDLDRVSFLMKVFNSIGTPVDTGLAMLPENLRNKIQLVIQKALRTAIKANLRTMKKSGDTKPSLNTAYKVAIGVSGAAGGFFGVAGFTTDLLLSTKFMMRTIMDIARSQGEDIQDIETQLACLQVFALGGATKEDEALDTSYYTTRAALKTATNRAAAYIAEHGTKDILKVLASQTSSPVARLISLIASRYSVQVSQKFAAQAIPVMGAAAGATLNILFITHFQKMATAHFTLRRLERKYGKELVENSYRQATTS